MAGQLGRDCANVYCKGPKDFLSTMNNLGKLLFSGPIYFFLTDSARGHLLVEKASTHWIGPCPISFLCFCSKAKGNYWSGIVISISIGNNFNFPVKRWGLKRHQQRATVRGLCQGPTTCSFVVEGNQKPVKHGAVALSPELAEAR
jgi:hypothetical protein